jgi:hypothetical protein
LILILRFFYSVTIQNVQEQAHDLWRYQRFLIVNEYSEKPPLPPPLNIIYYLFIILRSIIRFCYNRNCTIVDKGTLFNSVQQQWKSMCND